jgi:hypothetical protein
MEVTYLVGMRSSHEYDGTFSWDLPCSSRVDFSKEEVNKEGQGPDDQIVEPWYEVLVSLLLSLPLWLLRRCVTRHDGGESVQAVPEVFW